MVTGALLPLLVSGSGFCCVAGEEENDDSPGFDLVTGLGLGGNLEDFGANFDVFAGAFLGTSMSRSRSKSMSIFLLCGTPLKCICEGLSKLDTVVVGLSRHAGRRMELSNRGSDQQWQRMTRASSAMKKLDDGRSS